MATKVVKVIFIVGPTAGGKSALAMQLAETLGGEIICADSQTIRRDMNIGTAKPSRDDQMRVPHHMLDSIDPYQEYSVAQFKQDAEVCLSAINNRDKIAIVVGGTGLYIDALYYDYQFTTGSKDEALRSELNKKSVEQLQAELVSKGIPLPANDKNPRHLIRAIETEGISSKVKTPMKDSLIIGIDPGRESIAGRIKKRIRLNYEYGLVEELEKLVAKYGPPTRLFDAIAYRFALDYINALCSLQEAKELTFIAERQYAKRQVTWFKRNPALTWFTDGQAAYNFVRSQIIA